MHNVVEVFEPEMFKEDPDAVLNMYLYYRTDYGYTALFDGRTYNSYNDPEKFDLENWECTERCEAASGGYFIINKGDKGCRKRLCFLKRCYRRRL